MEWTNIQFRNYSPSASFDLFSSLKPPDADFGHLLYRLTTPLFERYHGRILVNGYSQPTTQV